MDWEKLRKPKSQVEQGLVLLMKYFGWTLEDLKKLPFPSYLALVEIISEVEKKNKAKK